MELTNLTMYTFVMKYPVPGNEFQELKCFTLSLTHYRTAILFPHWKTQCLNH